MQLSEQLKNHKPYWADYKIQALPGDILIGTFTVSHYWADSTSINVCDVIGTAHQEYAGKSWQWLLENGRRMPHNLGLLDNNPVYYEEQCKKEPSMYFVKLNDKLYIGADGNHRTCIAKYLFDIEGKSVLHGVTLDEYTIDYSMFNLYSLLKEFAVSNNLRWIIEPQRELVERIDGAGWKRDNYKIKIKITNSKSMYSVEITSFSEFYSLIKDYNKLFKKIRGVYKELWK